MLSLTVACPSCKPGYGKLWHKVSSGVQMETRILSPAVSWFLCTYGSGWMALARSLLGQEFEQKWRSYLCSQVCQHSWDTCFLQLVFGYRVLWHRISSGCRQKPEGSCARLPLVSLVQRFLSRSPRAEVVVLPVLVSTPERPTLSQWYLGCSTGSAPSGIFLLKLNLHGNISNIPSR